MELRKEKRFKDLKKKYAYDIALDKQAVDNISEEDLYNSLLILDFQEKIGDMFEEILTEWETPTGTAESEVLECMVAMFAKNIHEISGQLSAEDDLRGLSIKHMANEIIFNGLEGEEE